MTATATVQLTTAGSVRALVRAGLGVTVAACVATTVVAGVGRAAGVSLDLAGEGIPLYAFPQLTAICSLVGLVLAVVFARRAGAPRRTFVRTTAGLTAVSLVPDAIVDAAVETRGLLMLTHLVAAVIVIPAISSRLPE